MCFVFLGILVRLRLRLAAARPNSRLLALTVCIVQFGEMKVCFSGLKETEKEEGIHHSCKVRAPRQLPRPGNQYQNQFLNILYFFLVPTTIVWNLSLLQPYLELLLRRPRPPPAATTTAPPPKPLSFPSIPCTAPSPRCRRPRTISRPSASPFPSPTATPSAIQTAMQTRVWPTTTPRSPQNRPRRE